MRTLLSAVLLLGVMAGCGGGDDDGDVAADAGPGSIDSGAADGQEATGACTPYATAIEGGLDAAIGGAVDACTRGPCVTCALDGGAGPDCGAGGTMTSCLLDCIEVNDFGACDGGACDEGYTCDVGPDVCRNDAATTVNDALTSSDLDADCTACFAGVRVCIATGGCNLSCVSAGCECDTCQCDQECPHAFHACSGLDVYLDCAAVADECPS